MKFLATSFDSPHADQMPCVGLGPPARKRSQTPNWRRIEEHSDESVSPAWKRAASARSIKITDRPAAANLNAVADPEGPPPRTATSKSVMAGFFLVRRKLSCQTRLRKPQNPIGSSAPPYSREPHLADALLSGRG